MKKSQKSKMDFTLVSIAAFSDRSKQLRIVRLVLSKEKEKEKVFRPFASFTLNPETQIPNYFSERCGLTNEQLQDAPIFEQIAPTLFNFLQSSVLVSHDASFVHYALQSEFKKEGYRFNIPQVCTKRLCKQLLPNLNAYDLDYLCSVLGIHDYLAGDTDAENLALTTLFGRLLALDEDGTVISNMLGKVNKKVVSFANNITLEQLKKLPYHAGIYLFLDKQDKVIYAGKAKNIRKRVLSHFHNESVKERNLCRATFSIDFKLAGSELIALLMEADHIQRLDPSHNHIQKKAYTTYHIVPQRTKKGVLQLQIERRPFVHVPTEIFLKRSEAIQRLVELTIKFKLCPCHTQTLTQFGKCSSLSNSHVCTLCSGEDTLATYNARVKAAVQYLNTENQNFVLFEKGRVQGERSFVLVLHGVYQGFGFVDQEQSITSISALTHLLYPKSHTYHTAKIIKSYIKKFPFKIRSFEKT